MKKILIAGGCGFLGSHLVDRLVLRSDIDKLVVVDNLWTGRKQNIAHVRDERLHVIINDVETFQSYEQFDEIYHLASPASPPWYMTEPRRTISANLIGAMRLLDLLVPGGRIGFTSTSEIYGDPLVSPQPESYRGSVDCTGPRSSYDESKRCTEALLFEYQRTKKTDVRVARLFNVYGPRTRPDDGRAVSNFLTQALSGQPITVYGDGSQTRSWGYVDDVVEGLSRFFWRDTFEYSGPLNIGHDREVSVIDMARYVADLVGDVPIVHLPPVPQDPTNRRPDLTIARKILPGWECRIPFEEGIARTLRWFRASFGDVDFHFDAPPPPVLGERLLGETADSLPAGEDR
ncbi:NAD-dependent epimerase/dehydratase family protein [Chthonobacter rhizosphaerae]|uniref:NAD-dependent epimerase/dehydratase family protein n=1 Tax=Chthonobacter rhizosphaerae TaxID=2735553 RepID=UPI0015EF1BE8|nr:NAD-dependent epimerase/dehydratase family protein [Chthonobacter rhizosphaerae]